jgi:hypothetical protein
VCQSLLSTPCGGLSDLAYGRIQGSGLRRGGCGAVAGWNLKHCCKSARTDPSRPLPSLRIRRDDHRWSTQDLHARSRRRPGPDCRSNPVETSWTAPCESDSDPIQPFTPSALCGPVRQECQQLKAVPNLFDFSRRRHKVYSVNDFPFLSYAPRPITA